MRQLRLFLLLLVFCQLQIVVAQENYKVLIDFQFDKIRSWNDSRLVAVEKNGKWGFIDYKSKIVIDFQFDDTYSFYEDLAPVKKNGKWGYINHDGNVIIDYKFNSVNFFLNGLAQAQKNEKWGYIDKKGRTVIDFQFDETGSFYEDLAPVKKNGKWGWIDKEGKTVIDFQFDYVYSFSDGLAAVEKDGKWGWIDKAGKIVINFRYDSGGFFMNGLSQAGKNKKVGWIDKAGETVIDYQFENGRPFEDGFAAVEKDGKWGWINKVGNTVIDYQFDDIGNFSNGFAAVKKSGKWGWIDKAGRIVIDYQFDDMDFIVLNGGVSVKKNEKWGFIKIPTSISEEIEYYVTEKINQWQQKGEFEKMADYQQRVNTQTRNQKIQAFTQEAVEKMKSEFKKTIDLSDFELKEYDADNETFLIHSKSFNDFAIKVPISEASFFKKNWQNMQFSGFDFYIDDNKFQLAKLVVTDPVNHKDYLYDSNQPTYYLSNNITYNFDPIKIDVVQKRNENNKFEYKDIEVGKSDIDINIPVNKTINAKTFAVIIANENYQREAQVIFARNDGETFKKYCIQTLGLPEKNVHFVENATLNNIRGEINWVASVANAYKGEANVIFYYAGHGIPDESSKAAYLLPVDGYGSDVITGYKLEDLYARLGGLPAKNITLFMDACFSGAQRSGQMLASARGVAIKIKQDAPQGNMVVFSAAQGDETAYPYKEKGHGLFTYFLLKKLQETKGAVTLGELSNYITTNVSQQSIVVNSKSQTPTVVPSASVGDGWKGVMLR